MIDLFSFDFLLQLDKVIDILSSKMRLLYINVDDKRIKGKEEEEFLFSFFFSKRVNARELIEIRDSMDEGLWNESTLYFGL